MVSFKHFLFWQSTQNSTPIIPPALSGRYVDSVSRGEFCCIIAGIIVVGTVIFSLLILHTIWQICVWICLRKGTSSLCASGFGSMPLYRLPFSYAPNAGFKKRKQLLIQIWRSLYSELWDCILIIWSFLLSSRLLFAWPLVIHHPEEYIKLFHFWS